MLMTTTGVETAGTESSLEPVGDALYRTPAENPFGDAVQSRAYLLKRDAGNLLLYSSSQLKWHAGAIAALGGIREQYLNHRDEASAACDWVRTAFGAPLICHEKEREAVSRHCLVDRTFREERQLYADFRAVPTPGHCPGSTCYLWEHGGHRYLFTGDTLYLNHGQLEVFVSRGTKEEMVASLERIQSLDVNVLVPGLYLGRQSTLAADPGTLNRRIDAVIDSLWR